LALSVCKTRKEWGAKKWDSDNNWGGSPLLVGRDHILTGHLNPLAEPKVRSSHEKEEGYWYQGPPWIYFVFS